MFENRESLKAGKPWDGVWSRSKGFHQMGNASAFEVAAAWLDQPGILTVEDWGCGGGYFKPFLASHQTWIGVDACVESAALEIADLTRPRSRAVDGIHCRGVIEHCHAWDVVVDNVVRCFTKRAVLTLWLPFSEETTYNSTSSGVPVYRIKKEDLFNRFPSDVSTKITEVPRTKGIENEVVVMLSREQP